MGLIEDTEQTAKELSSELELAIRLIRSGSLPDQMQIVLEWVRIKLDQAFVAGYNRGAQDREENDNAGND